MPIQHIPSSEIRIGMYVHRLDRPWVETPFMFQGFEVRDEEELEKLKQLTRHVYVMVPDEEIELTRAPAEHRHPLRESDVLHQVSYTEHSPVEQELERARPSHEVLAQLIVEIRKVMQTGRALNIDVLKQPVSQMVNSIVKNPDAYIWLTSIKKFDSFLYKDALTCAVLGTALGRRLGIRTEDLGELATGCLLMDIGKLSLPAELVHKSGRLGHDEWEQMKTHVELGVRFLERQSSNKRRILDVVRTHHERIDGSGYPAGSSADLIPLFGQIAGIVDQYVAVTSPRPFAKAMSPSEAETLLYQQRGLALDELLVDYFIQTLSTYPTGALVELSSGEVALVKAQSPHFRLKPSVILLLDANKQPYGNYTLVHLDDYKRDGRAVNIRRTLPAGACGLEIEELSL